MVDLTVARALILARRGEEQPADRLSGASERRGQQRAGLRAQQRVRDACEGMQPRRSLEQRRRWAYQSLIVHQNGATG